MKILEIKESEFEEKVLKSSKKVLVDFYANWCGPCKMLSPIVEEISENDDSYLYYKVDVDKAENIAREYGIMSIPALFIFENGEVKKQDLGYKSIDELKKFLEI